MLGNYSSNSLLNDFSINFVVVVSRFFCYRILESVNGWSVGLTNILQVILGTPLIDVVGLESRLQSERSKYLAADLKEAPSEEGKAQALCNFLSERQRCLEQQKSKESSLKKAPPVPYRFMTPQGLQIDLRLCNQEIMSSAKPHLLHILNSAMQVKFFFFVKMSKMI